MPGRTSFLVLIALLAAVWLTAAHAGPQADQRPADLVAEEAPNGTPKTEAARVELGRHLFYDRRLSVNGTMSCADCHRQELAFTDGRPRAVGSTGQIHPRSAMSLANVGEMRHLGWDDPYLTDLEDQALVPLLNEHPVEMGLAGHEDEAVARLRSEPVYADLFARAFPNAPEAQSERITLDRVVQSLASFERTLVSRDAPFDRWLRDEAPLPDGARRGMRLFFSARLGCSGCHRGPTFAAAGEEFHNTGLYDVDQDDLGLTSAYPKGSEGRYRHTGVAEDMGRFRTPTLRNVAVTAPYMHDGSVATLEEVVEIYARGGRTESPRKDERLQGFELTDGETSDLLAFLESLTDPSFLADPKFSNPWEPTT